MALEAFTDEDGTRYNPTPDGGYYYHDDFEGESGMYRYTPGKDGEDGVLTFTAAGTTEAVTVDELSLREFMEKNQNFSADSIKDAQTYLGKGEVSGNTKYDQYGNNVTPYPHSGAEPQAAVTVDGIDLQLGDFDDADLLKQVYIDVVYKDKLDQLGYIENAYNLGSTVAGDIADETVQNEADIVQGFDGMDDELDGKK